MALSEQQVVLLAELGVGVLAAAVAFLWERRRRPGIGGARARTSAQDQLDKLYLIIQLLAVTGTALQMAWLPALFTAYGYGIGEIRTFDLVALGAAVLTGALLASYADTFGRRKAMQAWAVVSLVSAVLATDSSMSVLVVARILSGIAAGLLGSAFNAWFVGQHAPGEPLAQAFAACVAWSGLALVLAQLVGYYAAQLFGPVGPIYVSGLVVCTALFVISACCPENYGDRAAGSGSLPAALKAVVGDRRLRALAVTQALADWAVAVMALRWHRALVLHATARASVRTYLPICTAIGAVAFAQVSDRRPAVLESLMPWVTAAASLALVLAAYLPQTSIRVLALFLFQVGVGLYWPCQAALRAKHVPEERRAAVLGLLSVTGAVAQIVTLQYDDWFQGDVVLWLGAGLLALSSLCQQIVLDRADAKADTIIAVAADDEMATA